MAVHDHNSASDLMNPKEGLVPISDHSKESISFIAPTSSDVVNSTVVYSKLVPEEPVAVATLKELAQETVKRQFLVYWGLTLMVLFRRLMHLW